MAVNAGDVQPKHIGQVPQWPAVTQWPQTNATLESALTSGS